MSTKHLILNAAALALAGGLLAAAQAAPHPAPPASTAQTVRVAAGSTDDVTLDFVGADINDVLKALSMQTHTNIVSGSDVKGTITVSLAHVTLEDALDLITKLSGFQYAKIGHTYLVGSSAAIQSLAASGTAQTPAVTSVISFSYSDQADLVAEIKQLYPNVKASTGKAAGGQAGGGVLVVTGTADDIDGVRRLVGDSEAAISRNIGSSQTELYNIKYASSDDLETVLGRLVPSIIVTPAPAQRAYAAAPTTADAGGVTSSTTSFGAAAGATGGTTIATTGNIATKPTTTALLLTGSPADLTRARQVLAQVDLRPVQLNFEAKITEISVQKADELGLTYDFTGAKTTVGETLQSGETPASTTFIDPYVGKILKLRTFGRTPLSQFVNVQLHALVTAGDAKILASPTISAIDGQPAATFVGDTVSYISSVTQSPTGTNITTSTVNAGIKLFVTGKVNNDGYITLNVHPEVSIVTLSQAGAGGVQVPDVRVREATTTVRVKDGDYIAISGLINDQITKDIQKVPILGDIPFFGQLFTSTRKSHTRDEVLIFIKVSIQKDPVVASAS
jgi:type II secretory pathway component GspD/PulD (secretin)